MFLHDDASCYRIVRDPVTGVEHLETRLRGYALLDHPSLNKGTAFSEQERDALGLRGLLPPRVCTMEEQITRVMENYARKSSDIERYIHLIALLDRNETLFYRVLLDRLEDLLPIAYTPTVGQACASFGHIYRRARGIYITPEDAGRVRDVLSNWPTRDVSAIVVTDGERILGLGDLGANGMGISIGKLNLYVAGAGIYPARTLPICLDTGTENGSLLTDPLYLGKPRRRLRGKPYDDLVAELVEAARALFPGVLVQFEDFGKANASRLLDAFRGKALCFNDDIQGTGAVTLAAVLAALRLTGGALDAQRVVIAGAGSAAIGIARALRGASIWMLDSRGLLTTSRERLSDAQAPFARDEPGGTLLDVVRRVRPTVLIGVTTHAGVFTRDVITSMDGARPIVLPLSNPTSRAECTPGEVREWLGDRAIVATGSPFPGVPQCNNLYIFPGVALGALAARAERVTDAMFHAAATAIATMAAGEALFPPIRSIRTLSSSVAHAVAREAVASGVAPAADDDTLSERIAQKVWEPRYLPYRPAAGA